MADEALLQILSQGPDKWNEWRSQQSGTLIPDFTRANLKKAELSGAALRKADFTGANLTGANLTGASLFEAKLSGADLLLANLASATLVQADLSYANLAMADLSSANLYRARLNNAELGSATLTRAILEHSFLEGAQISGAMMGGANLSSAKLSRAHLAAVDLTDAVLKFAHAFDTLFTKVNLSNADLTGAHLSGTIFSRANLYGAKFRRASMSGVLFSDVDLRNAVSLEEVRHHGPSEISLSTIYKSEGRIPEVFLHGCGVPESTIVQIPALVGAVRPIQFYSCFISYSTKDEEFAKRLHSRMREAEMRVWFAPEDIKGGQKLYEQIDRAIQVHDRLLLVLSESSMKSEWVMTEVRRARKTEMSGGRRKLFPIRLVDYEAIREWECFDADHGKDLAVEIREYYIPDFSNWKNHDDFEREFNRLYESLKAEA